MTSRSRNLLHLSTRLCAPLMIEPRRLAVIQDVFWRLCGTRVDDGFESDFEPEPHEDVDAPARIKVIPILGTLVHRRLGMDALSGLASMQQIGAMIDEAANDRSIDGILLDVDSPGGEASGAFDLADKIRAADAKKPVVAVSNESAFSGGYLLASAARKLIVPRTGGVGSVGVVSTHVDVSRAEGNAGVQVTHVYAGEQKVDGTPHQPLAEPARQRIQAEVDRLYDLFTGTVAKHRGISQEAVKATEAGLYFGERAVDAGLADQVGTIETALDVLQAEIKQGRNGGSQGLRSNVLAFTRRTA